ncbi:MAG: hypothetical protein A3I66_15955 [Burkholderiales bacterium RIFCSPLOWO2_02_FULL_57_36]|nr:MAG: hypothetical protein A3I66_15955 [Burkholderiales bacterium RIFCSPLOWO2_02_FULL_57_36]
MSRKTFASGGSTQGEIADENAGTENLSASQGKSMFDEHKGKLAIGVAATLGVMIFYNWLEKQLAKEDPEAHARLQRLKAVVRAREANLRDDDIDDHENFENAAASQVMRCKGNDGVAAAS